MGRYQNQHIGHRERSHNLRVGNSMYSARERDSAQERADSDGLLTGRFARNRHRQFSCRMSDRRSPREFEWR